MINYIVKDLVEVLKEHKGYVAFATTADFAMGSGVAKQMDKEFDLKSQFKNRFDKFYKENAIEYVGSYKLNRIMMLVPKLRVAYRKKMQLKALRYVVSLLYQT